MVYPSAGGQQSKHWARCRVTSLIEINALVLIQPAIGMAGILFITVFPRSFTVANDWFHVVFIITIILSITSNWVIIIALNHLNRRWSLLNKYLIPLILTDPSDETNPEIARSHNVSAMTPARIFLLTYLKKVPTSTALLQLSCAEPWTPRVNSVVRGLL